MVQITLNRCDHCGTDDSRGGVGPGNVNPVEIVLKILKQVPMQTNVDLCDGCEEELKRAIARWTGPKETLR